MMKRHIYQSSQRLAIKTTKQFVKTVSKTLPVNFKFTQTKKAFKLTINRKGKVLVKPNAKSVKII